MANKHFIQQPLWIVDCEERYSEQNDQWFDTVTLVGDTDGEIYQTYVSRDNKNYQSWAKPLRALLQDNQATQLTGKFPTKGISRKDNIPLINADSKFSINTTHNVDEVMNLVNKLFYKD